MSRSRSSPKKSAPPVVAKKRSPATYSHTPDGVVRKRPPITITLSPEAIERVDEIARESGMSRSGVIEALIRRARTGSPPDVLTPDESVHPPPPPSGAPPQEPAVAGRVRRKRSEIVR